MRQNWIEVVDLIVVAGLKSYLVDLRVTHALQQCPQQIPQKYLYNNCIKCSYHKHSSVCTRVINMCPNCCNSHLAPKPFLANFFAPLSFFLPLAFFGASRRPPSGLTSKEKVFVATGMLGSAWPQATHCCAIHFVSRAFVAVCSVLTAHHLYFFFEDHAIHHISSVLLLPPHNMTHQYSHCIKLGYSL